VKTIQTKPKSPNLIMPTTKGDKPQKRAVKAVAKEEKKTAKTKKAPAQGKYQFMYTLFLAMAK
jgi:hypothetical protein